MYKLITLIVLPGDWCLMNASIINIICHSYSYIKPVLYNKCFTFNIVFHNVPFDAVAYLLTDYDLS